MDKRQFILETLLPYKENPTLCAFSNNSCRYITDDGKKCAVGKHMKEGDWQKREKSYLYLVQEYKPSDFFTDEALAQNLSKNEWMAIQQYHDTIAMNNYEENVNDAVINLENVTELKFPELKFN